MAYVLSKENNLPNRCLFLQGPVKNILANFLDAFLLHPRVVELCGSEYQGGGGLLKYISNHS